jgi:hypothetical protein
MSRSYRDSDQVSAARKEECYIGVMKVKKPEDTLEEMLNAIRDSPSNLANSHNDEEGQDEK